MEIWTDGACLPGRGVGGWGWHSSSGKSACGGEPFTTNNRMEMTAILQALIELPKGTVVTVYSDSTYCVNGIMKWRGGWKRRNWRRDGQDIPNRDLWMLLEVQLKRLNVKMVWVKGHDGNAGNEKADKLASQGRRYTLMSMDQESALPY